jgi:acetyltransferase-like isoleucine patch superfamily enzyme
MKQKENKPYYKAAKNIFSQIKSGSDRTSQSKLKFIWKKIKNYFLATLAYNCPINSLRIKFHRWRGVTIGKNVLIGLRVTLDHSYPEYIYIEDDVSLAGNNYVLAHSNPYPHFKDVLPSFVAPVVLKRGCWLGIGTTIMPGVNIGDESVIATGSVVTKNVDSRTLVAGVPARFIKDININLDK